MNRDQDFDQVVREWLDIGPTQLSDRASEATRLGVGRTRQRHPSSRVIRWPEGRTARLMAVAAVLVMVVGTSLALRPSQERNAIGGLSGSASPTIVPTTSAQGPAHLVLSFHVRNPTPMFDSSPGGPPVDAAAMDTIRDVVQRRLDAAGFVDPAVTFWDERFGIYVDLPVTSGTLGGSPRDRAETIRVRSILEQRGELTVVPLPADTYGTTSTGGPTDVAEGQPLPDDARLKPLVSSAAITAADLTSDENGSPAVRIQLDGAATALVADYTNDHLGGFLAIVLDDTVVAITSISSPITDGAATIALGAGSDVTTQATDLLVFLRSGALPFQLDFVDAVWKPSS